MLLSFATWIGCTIYTQTVLPLILLDRIEEGAIWIRGHPMIGFGIEALLPKRMF